MVLQPIRGQGTCDERRGVFIYCPTTSDIEYKTGWISMVSFKYAVFVLNKLICIYLSPGIWTGNEDLAFSPSMEHVYRLYCAVDCNNEIYEAFKLIILLKLH